MNDNQYLLLDALSKQRDAISSHGYATGRINNATAARMEAELVRIAVKLADEWKRSKYAEQPQAGRDKRREGESGDH